MITTTVIIIILVIALIIKINYKGNCCPRCGAFRPTLYVQPPSFGMHGNTTYTCTVCRGSWTESFHGPY